MIGDLLCNAGGTAEWSEWLGPGAVVLRGFGLDEAVTMFSGVQEVVAQAPFRHMQTRGGFRMSVAMTNCGALGWVSDRAGYCYQVLDPLTAQPWPAMPPSFARLATAAAAQAGFPNFMPDACLINRYEPGARMALHQDKDERDLSQPIVSVSFGLPAVFQLGGLQRSDSVQRVTLTHGDVVIWGGVDRLRYHGVLALKAGVHPVLGSMRLNLTFRRAN